MLSPALISNVLSAVLAQNESPTAPDGVEMGGGIPTVSELFMTSPYINGLILLLSLLALAVFVFVFLGLNRGAFAPPRFIDDVTKAILNRKFEHAEHLCQSNSRCFAAPIIQRLIEHRDEEPVMLMGVLEAEGKRRADAIWNRIGYLAEIATIAPTLGLLGTVIGMIKVFFTLTTRVAGTPNITKLSGGIAEAMGTTMFGLIVALIAGVFYTVARSRATTVLADTEQIVHSVADHTHHAMTPTEGGEG
jgi:biopolymer transport protein ExbB